MYEPYSSNNSEFYPKILNSNTTPNKSLVQITIYLFSETNLLAVPLCYISVYPSVRPYSVGNFTFSSPAKFILL